MNLRKTIQPKVMIGQIAGILMICIILNLYSCKATKKEASTNINTLVDSLAKSLMSENKIPGMSIAVTVDGKHSFFNYGIISKESNKPVTNQSLFELGSISKTFTVTLASLSQINGNLDMQSPVSNYLPHLKNTVFDSVKLYYLGTHIAGGLPLQLPDNITTDEQLMNYYKTWVPLYAPGTKRVYSNPSIGLLGIIAGKTMNETFTKAMTDHVFSKIGMSNTFYDVPQNKMGDYAQGYNKEDKPVRLNPAVLANEAYGIKSCTQDMLKFVDRNMGVGNLDAQLSKALEATHTGYFTTGVMTQDLIWEQYNYPASLSQLLEGNAAEMAYKASDIKPLVPPMKPQPNVVINKTGSTNGFASYVIYIPSKKIGIVILANKNYPIKPRVETAYKILSYLDNPKNKL